jgi:hypothetical protein
MLHVTDKDLLLLDTEVIPAKAADLSQTQTAEDRKDNNFGKRIF